MTVYWLPAVASPEAPTPSELAAGVELPALLQPLQFTFVADVVAPFPRIEVRFRAEPRAYRWLTGRAHPRIRRMHSAYRRRRRR